MLSIGSSTPSPSRMKTGQIKSSALSRFSWTKERMASDWRVRRSRAAGNGATVGRIFTSQSVAIQLPRINLRDKGRNCLTCALCGGVEDKDAAGIVGGDVVVDVSIDCILDLNPGYVEFSSIIANHNLF